MPVPFGIEVRFVPFGTRRLSAETPLPTGEQDLPDVSWCLLPDVLLSSGSRAFVGLSFAVVPGKEHVARQLCGDSKHAHLVLRTDATHLDRYAGFGPLSRLEMIWSPAEKIECELASLSDGYWFGIHDLGVVSPRGYRLLGLPDLVLDHDLQWLGV
jgi:hypothetical protein